MKLRLVAFFILHSIATHGIGSGPDDVTDPAVERWDRIICLATETTANGPSKTGQKLASCFAVATADGLTLVTASHAARETSPETKVGLRLPNGETIGFQIKDVSLEGQDPWKHHPASDLAILPIPSHVLSPAIAHGLRAVAVPIDAIEKDIPTRTTGIEITGFPMGLGAANLSPLAMKGFIASRELEVKTKWGQEPIILAVPTVGAGTSGGAVFRSVDDPAAVSMVGMYIGMMFDDSGVKLSRIVPSRVIREFVEADAQARTQPRQELP